MLIYCALLGFIYMTDLSDVIYMLTFGNMLDNPLDYLDHDRLFVAPSYINYEYDCFPRTSKAIKILEISSGS